MRRPWFITVVLACLLATIVGTALRITGLSEQIYRNDEAWTKLWVSGHRVGDLRDDLCGRLSTADELRRYFHTTPGRGVIQTVAAVATDDPKQSPGYYALLRLWVEVAGHSRGAGRSFSVIWGLLAILAAFLAGRELAGSSMAGWLAAALVAVSPAQILYSQDLRPYSFYAAMVLLASWALLRAMRRGTAGSWRLYALALVVGLYVHTLFLLVIGTHAGYVLVVCSEGSERPPWRAAPVAPFVRSAFWAAAAFLPWVVVFFLGWRRGLGGMRWLLNPVPLPELFKSWMRVWGTAFIDVTELRLELTPAFRIPLLLHTAVMVVVVLSLLYLCRTTHRKVWALPLLLFLVPLLVLVPPDIVLGGQSSAVDRYMVSGYLGADLGLACLLAGLLAGSWANRSFGMLLLVVFVVAGAASAVLNARTVAPGIKGPAREYTRVAEVLHHAERPLLICDCPTAVRFLSFSPFLGDHVSVALLGEHDPLVVPPETDEVFLFRGPVGSVIADRFSLKPTSAGDQLWRVAMNP